MLNTFKTFVNIVLISIMLPRQKKAKTVTRRDWNHIVVFIFLFEYIHILVTHTHDLSEIAVFRYLNHI